ncbi:acyl carrier protein [Priestia megaterium]|jgi:acyl carrier protein|uniref:acyl carrier protein n=1 Tax=Priestia megaterium TaxID=1404 RepID=UPI0021BE4EFA|nr:acyl carrier protein [Priestia megaterium]MCT9852414.1 acyl carrier protein [Priestia megaterium]MDF1964287.1 acyl carrier protein [Priestia megaterium]
MTKEEILVKGKQIIVERLEVEEEKINLESNFKEDLGADSLDIVELIMELEDQFELEIPDEEAENFSTVGEVVDYFYNHLQGKLVK